MVCTREICSVAKKCTYFKGKIIISCFYTSRSRTALSQRKYNITYLYSLTEFWISFGTVWITFGTVWIISYSLIHEVYVMFHCHFKIFLSSVGCVGLSLALFCLMQWRINYLFTGRMIHFVLQFTILKRVHNI